jgi:dTDP-4-amino-4,6-dideoxygalactose transaminase
MQAVLGQHGVEAYSHYVPLHLSEGGRKWARPHGDMQHTVEAGSQLLRLPMWPYMTCVHVHQVRHV